MTQAGVAILRMKSHGWITMNTTAGTSPSPPATVAKHPVGSNAAQAWDNICRGMGITTDPAEKAVDLLISDSDAMDEFEHTINEAFEQVEEPSKLS